MKVSIFVMMTIAMVLAEPPSNSYLPPSPGEVVAARSFGRNGARGINLDVSDDGYSYDQNGLGRNGIEAGQEPANYNFGYSVNDEYAGTAFGHREERHEERAHGEYHVLLPDGRKQVLAAIRQATVHYEADETGFKPKVSYQDEDEEGYDSNANSRGHQNGSHRGVNGNRDGHKNGNGYHSGRHGSHSNVF